jgi:hypothetical protein
MASNTVADARPETDDISKTPQSDYLDRLMRRGSFEALWPLFARAQRPAKELTESYSALVHLRPFLASGGPYRVVHVGDGAHARTAAMFALKTKAENVSVDPELNVRLVEEWRERFAVRRFDWRKALIQDVAAELDALPEMPTLVTFVHAHISVDHVLGMFRWDAAFTLSCCSPGKQLTQRFAIETSGDDPNVLSPGRSYQVLVNRPVGRRPSHGSRVTLQVP